MRIAVHSLIGQEPSARASSMYDLGKRVTPSPENLGFRVYGLGPPSRPVLPPICTSTARECLSSRGAGGGKPTPGRELPTGNSIRRWKLVSAGLWTSQFTAGSFQNSCVLFSRGSTLSILFRLGIEETPHFEIPTSSDSNSLRKYC